MAIMSIIIIISAIIVIFRHRHHCRGHRIIGVMTLAPYLTYTSTAPSGSAWRAEDATMTVVVAWMIIIIITLIMHHHHHHHHHHPDQHHHDPSSLLS